MSYEVAVVVKNRWVESITDITAETLVTFTTRMTVPQAAKTQHFRMTKVTTISRRKSKKILTMSHEMGLLTEKTFNGPLIR